MYSHSFLGGTQNWRTFLEGPWIKPWTWGRVLAAQVCLLCDKNYRGSSLGQVIEHTTKLSEFFCFSYVLQIYAFKTKVIFKHLIRTRIILVEKGANINQKTNVNEASADVHSTGKIINTSKNPASLEHVSSKSSHWWDQEVITYI